MKKYFAAFLLFLLFSSAELSGATSPDSISFALKQDFTEYTSSDQRPHPLLYRFRKKQERNKHVIAALLALPLPFGIVGLHRIYLGCSSYVPVVYIATAGGIFGILPFIDFCVLLLDNDLERYINNERVFMWMAE